MYLLFLKRNNRSEETIDRLIPLGNNHILEHKNEIIMNRFYLFVSMILIMIVVSLNYLGIITTNWSLIIILLGISPMIYDSLFRSKAVLSINNIHFEKKEFDQVTGYQLIAEVMNKGQGISDLIAAITVNDTLGQPPNLTRVDVREERGQQEVRSKDAEKKNIDYAWIDADGKEKIKVLEVLDSNEMVSLVFPYEAFRVGGGDRWFSYRILLSLEKNSEYNVQIEIQGRDGKKNRFLKKKELILIAQ